MGLTPRPLDAPLRIDAGGRTARTTHAEHVRDMVEHVLFTTPGERVNRPDFGCGLGALVFLPNSEALAAATQTLVKASLQRWLEREIVVEDVTVRAHEGELHVDVAYVLRDTGEPVADTFVRPGAGT